MVDKMKQKMIFTIFLIIMACTFSFAHEGEKHDGKENSDTVTVVNGDTIAINGIATDSAKIAKLNTEDEVRGEYEIKIPNAFTEHIHNKVIHFPIALTFAGFLLMYFYWKDDKYRNAVLTLVGLGTLAAIAAYFSGQIQEAAFEGTPKEWVVGNHETFGIISAISLVLWTISLFSINYKKLSIILSITTLILVLITGFYGGVIAH
jgi:uncharacterized membrane protein